MLQAHHDAFPKTSARSPQDCAEDPKNGPLPAGIEAVVRRAATCGMDSPTPIIGPDFPPTSLKFGCAFTIPLVVNSWSIFRVGR
jgi:hypothetical protein